MMSDKFDEACEKIADSLIAIHDRPLRNNSSYVERELRPLVTDSRFGASRYSKYDARDEIGMIVRFLYNSTEEEFKFFKDLSEKLIDMFNEKEHVKENAYKNSGILERAEAILAQLPDNAEEEPHDE